MADNRISLHHGGLNRHDKIVISNLCKLWYLGDCGFSILLVGKVKQLGDSSGLDLIVNTSFPSTVQGWPCTRFWNLSFSTMALRLQKSCSPKLPSSVKEIVCWICHIEWLFEVLCSCVSMLKLSCRHSCQSRTWRKWEPVSCNIHLSSQSYILFYGSQRLQRAQVKNTTSTVSATYVLKSPLQMFNEHMKCTHLKCTVWWVLTNACTYVNTIPLR